MFQYDGLGNLRQRQVGTRTIALSYDANNRLSSHTDTAGSARSLSYDARGNVTALGALGFTYDYSDQPRTVTGTATGSYTYDGHMRRVKQVVGGVTRYSVYDASGSLIEIDEVSGPKTDYIRASGMTLARIAGKVLDRKAEESSVNLGHSQNRTFATIVATGSLGPVRLPSSGSGNGRLKPIVSFDRLTCTWPDFAESGHYTAPGFRSPFMTISKSAGAAGGPLAFVMSGASEVLVARMMARQTVCFQFDYINVHPTRTMRRCRRRKPSDSMRPQFTSWENRIGVPDVV